MRLNMNTYQATILNPKPGAPPAMLSFHEVLFILYPSPPGYHHPSHSLGRGGGSPNCKPSHVKTQLMTIAITSLGW